jgi:hypothetical protein
MGLMGQYLGAGVAQSVDIVSDYGLGDRGSIPCRGKRILLLASMSRSALRLTQPPVQWVSGVLSPGLKRGWGVTLTTQSHLSAAVKDEQELYFLSPKAPSWRVVGQL